MEIKVVKLISGEEVIAGIEEGDGYVYLHKPAKLVITPQGPGMMPWSPLMSSEKVQIDKTHVMCQFDLELEIRNAYSHQFGIGIQLTSPTGGLIL
jgi:hypothetical protein